MDLFLSDSDWETSSESGSSDDLEQAEYLYSSQASCILSSLEETIEKIDEFLSFEREFMFGDIVCSVKDPSGQMGKVVGIDMLVDLEKNHGPVIKDINTKNLLKVRSISVGDYVVYGPWIGRIDKIIDSVNVLFDDGTKRGFLTMDQEKLLPVSIDALDDSQYPYYPGQRVKLSNVSKQPRWLSGRKVDRGEGTICSVEAGLVCINWLASVLMGCNSSLPAPPRLHDAKSVALLSCFPHANWHLGDWCIFPVEGNNDFSVKKSVTASTHSGDHGIGFQEISVIVKKRTKVDVLWQDGSHSSGLDSHMLAPANAVNAHEFWPHQLVMEKGSCDDPNMSRTQKWGVVRAVDAKERTVKVQWRTGAFIEGTDINRPMEETMSAYELVEHPDYSFSLGDVVFRLALDKFLGQSDKINITSDAPMTEHAAHYGENHVMDKKINLDVYLSCIGNVTGFKDGAVEVRWADCSTCMVSPQEIFPINKHQGSTTSMPNEENLEELRQDQIETLKYYNSQRGKNLPNYDGMGQNFKTNLWEFTTHFFSRAAFGFFSSICSTLLGSLQSTILSGRFSGMQIVEGQDEIDILYEKEALQTHGESTVLEMSKLHNFGETSSKLEEIHQYEDLTFSRSGENYNKFMQFDVATDCPDHHFLAAGEGSTLSQMRRSWLKKVQQEWSILKINLPETIYVRVFEERMDLIRAVIVGAPGTPYHDGLFVFDIFLPPEYPQIPPLVHYISGGLRVNPNLYESGKVCLSLLNTWTGTGSEVWNPGSSTVLQILLSLQALVLNEKPYYNEAGYDVQLGRAEGERNSACYNENAFILTCKSMLFLLNRPPKHFEALVLEHLKRRSQHILAACRSYMEGAPVGYDHQFGATEPGNQNQSSTGFKIMLAKIFPKLVGAFSSKGIDCSQFVEPENDLIV